LPGLVLKRSRFLSETIRKSVESILRLVHDFLEFRCLVSGDEQSGAPASGIALILIRGDPRPSNKEGLIAEPFLDLR
jgi:hypothetical protein